MAGAGWRDFVAGEVLTAANVQDYLQDQAVMTFASPAARGSAIASPTEGMVSFLKDSNLVEVYDGSAWKQLAGTTGSVLQVASTIKTDTFSTTTSSFTDITGLTVAITPKSTSSKVLVLTSIAGGIDPTAAVGAFQVTRGGTAIGVGDAAGSRIRGTSVRLAGESGANGLHYSGVVLDSPATTASVTYAAQIRSVNGAVVYVNRTPTDTDTNQYVRGASTITVMEIAG